jgi:hypothetical protein
VFVVALPFLAVVAVLLCFQDQPSITRAVQLKPEDIEYAKRIIDRHDPRKGDGRLRTLTISESDLDLAANYLASYFGRGAARTTLRSGKASMQASIMLPRNPIGRYLNVDVTLAETGALPRIEHLVVGRLSMPPVVGDYLLRESLRRFAATDRGAFATEFVKSATVADGSVTVTYAWNEALAERARAVLVGSEEAARLRAYQDRLVDVVAKAPPRLSLALLLRPMFDLARDRGARGDIVGENRAAILVLAFYANGKGLGEIVSAARQWPQPVPRTVTLAGRDDFPKHFLVSAAIAAEAGSPLADVIGVYKEVDDSRGGSGFSFNDIGADRGGTRFGEVATQSPERARKLAGAIAAGVRESDFMPDVLDLPEFMPEPEFKRRYGGVGGAGYNRMMAQIEARVASRPLLR